MFRNLKNKIGYKSGVSFSGPNPYIPSAAVPFSPADVAGLAIWYKVDSLSLSDGAAVSSWNDSSGNGRNATGGGGTANPTYKTNQVNGYGAVRFDKVNDYLTHPTLTNSGSSIFFVISGSSANTGNDGILSWNNGGNDYDGGNTLIYSTGFAGGSPSGWSGIWRGIGTFFTNITTPYVGWFSFNVIVKDGGSGNVNMVTRKNGTQLETKTAAGLLSNSPSNCFIGARGTGASAGAAFYGGDFAELIIYNVDIGATNRDAVELYLKTKYNLY